MKICMIISLNLIYSVAIFAQQLVEHSIPTNNVNVIVLQSSGQTFIKSSDENSLKIKSTMQSKGKVQSISTPAERPEFDIDYTFSSDTLYITTPDRFSPKVIGINTYSESIENTIEIPANKKLIVKSGGHLQFNRIQNNLIVQSADEIILKDLKKTHISELKCKASKSLYLNDAKKSKEFELHAYGSYSLVIHANTISLHIIE